MPHTISPIKLKVQIFKYLVFLWLISAIKYSRCSERFGKLVTQGKLCTDLDVDDANGEYTDLGTDVDIPTLFHHVKALRIPYPHTLRIVVPVGNVIQFEAFAAMAVDESGIPTGRFHSCASGNEPQSKIISGRCTISKDDWELTFMGYQDPLRIISTEKYDKAIEFYWTWLEDRNPPNLIQFRFLGIEKTSRNTPAKYYGVLASPVVETTELFRKTPPITLSQLNEMQCFKNEELQADSSDVSSSDYFSNAAGFAPQQQIPLNPQYLKLIQDNIEKFQLRPITTTISMLLDIEESTTTTTEKTTTAMAHKRHKKVSKQTKHQKKSTKYDFKASFPMPEYERQPKTTQSTTMKTTELVDTILGAEEEADYENVDYTELESLTQTRAINQISPSPMLVESKNSISAEIKPQISLPKLIESEKLIFAKNKPTTKKPVVFSHPTFSRENKLDKIFRKVSRSNSPVFNRPRRPYYYDIPPRVPTIQKMGQHDQETKPSRPSTPEDKDVDFSRPKHTAFHAISMLFIWIVCIPNAMFITRYFRETPSSKIYCGRSLSSMLNVKLLSLAFVLTVASVSVSFWDFVTRERSVDLLENMINTHVYLGVASSVLFGSFIVFECIACEQNKHCTKAFMHCFAGNISYIIALIMIWRSYLLGMPCATWMISLLWIIWTVTANVVMCSHFYWQERIVGFKNYFRAFLPLPIEINMQDETPGFHTKERILWWHFGGSWIAFIYISLLYSIKDEHCANCQFEFVLGCMPEDL